MKKVLLIGGAGYIGTGLSEDLLNDGHDVRCLDRFIYDNNSSITHLVSRENYEFMWGDFCNEDTLKNAFDGVDKVVILGGLVGDPITKTYPKEAEEINQDGVRLCLDYANKVGVERLIFISTCSNYGLMEDGKLADEDSPLNPLSAYAKAKVDAEKYLLEMSDSKSFTSTILRFATAFGLSSRMRFDLTISQFVYETMSGDELVVYDSETWRPYCHVKDFSRLIRMVLNAPKEQVDGQVFNAGGDENNFTKKKIIEAISKHIDTSNVSYKENGGDPRNYRVNFSKVRNVLGFEPKYSVEDGIKELKVAIENKIFKDMATNPKKYGNYELSLK